VALYAPGRVADGFGPRVERASVGERHLFGMGNSVVLSDGRWLGVFGEITSYWKTSGSAEAGSQVGASNGKAGAGAVWDLTPAVDGGRLDPHASSKPMQLTFRLRNPRSTAERHIDRFNLTLVRLYARVLGHLS